MAATVMELYGSKVFNEHEMRERLPSSTYKSLKAVSYTHLDVYKRQVISQYMRITRPSVGRQGRMVIVSGSGQSTRSLSSVFINPAMELPSKQTPSYLYISSAKLRLFVGKTK